MPRAGTGSASPASSAGALSSSVVGARPSPADFRVIRREWAALRDFLARRALKALRGIVRLQALVRGRLVRRQLAVTLGRMQALLRVQKRAMERRARCSADARSQDALSQDRNGLYCMCLSAVHPSGTMVWQARFCQRTKIKNAHEA